MAGPAQIWMNVSWAMTVRTIATILMVDTPALARKVTN